MTTVKVIIVIMMAVILCIRPYEAGARILMDHHHEEYQRHLILPSLQGGRRPVRPPSPNPCSNIPGGGGTCTRSTSTTAINERSYAGQLVHVNNANAHAAAPPPPPPSVEFGLAAN
ncbi:hypothetical protein M9H77_01349 [Catharanthus roseus]|uniref:Uncharacterized protein n=1 Tax=Catharanthus roseus TaxID=4058 RepID=A0ACC0C585_CATRO|nr:hypothetical protein M9H77_01349 [Catharanthus roseus]